MKGGGGCRREGGGWGRYMCILLLILLLLLLVLLLLLLLLALITIILTAKELAWVRHHIVRHGRASSRLVLLSKKFSFLKGISYQVSFLCEQISKLIA